MMDEPFETAEERGRWKGRRLYLRGDDYKWGNLLFGYRLAEDDVVLAAAIADANLSPNYWMAKYASRFVDGRERSALSRRNTCSCRRRYQDRWAIKLFDLGAFVRDCLLDFGSRAGTPEDRLIVLPRLLDAIRSGRLLNVYLPHRNDAPETFHRTWLRTEVQEVVSSYGSERAGLLREPRLLPPPLGAGAGPVWEEGG